MAYSDVTDLLTGDLAWSTRLDPENFVNAAAEEIDVKLTPLYKLPLVRSVNGIEVPLTDPQFTNPPGAGAGSVPPWELRLLKQINNKIASGRAIQAAAVSEEDGQVHAYGKYLLNEGLTELMLIANGDLVLDAVRADGIVITDDRARLPETINHDEESLLLGFENTVLRGDPFYSRPGAV